MSNGAGPRNTGGSRHPLGQTRGDRQAVRAAPGAAADGEPLNTEAVCDRGNVGDGVHHPPATEAIGAAVARPVVHDRARSDIHIRARVPLPVKTRARRAMEQEDREPIRVPPLGDRQRSPIDSRHRLRARRPSHDGIIFHRSPR